jgi:hypothetical protein
MAQMRVSVLATQCTANAAAIAAAVGGGCVTSDITALGAILALLAVSQDIMIPMMGQATTPALAPTMLTPS